MSALPEAQRQIASLPLAVVLLAPGQKIASANPAAEQFFGQSLRRLAGRSLFDWMRFDEPRLAERVGDSEARVSAREIGVTMTGMGPRRLDLTVAPVVDEPGWQVLTLHDASAAETMGENRGAADEVLLRGPEVLAHEIKNPLAGIRGAAQLLGRGADGKSKALTGLIAAEVDRIAKLIDEMQSLSQRTAPPLAPCNLHEAVRRAIAVLDAAGESRVRIEEEFDPSLPPLLGNADGLVRVVINLISNAVEACAAAEKPRVVVRTRFASGLRLHATGLGEPVRLPIELRVSDNGPGIDPAMREHVFDPFVTSKKSGQGLGLALVRKLVREMNGRVGYDRDDNGRWTHFRVHLQLAAAAPASGKKAKPQ